MVQLLISKVQQQQIEWRRDRVLELSSQGFTQSDIARILQVDRSLISRDMTYLSQQAQDNIQNHIQEKLPQEYQRCLAGLNQVLKTCWYIVNKPNTDDKTKLQATAIINDSYKYVMDLTVNGDVITKAIKYVISKMDHLNSAEKKFLQDIKNKGMEETEAAEAAEVAEAKDTNEGLEETEQQQQQQQTHNGIF